MPPATHERRARCRGPTSLEIRRPDPAPATAQRRTGYPDRGQCPTPLPEGRKNRISETRSYSHHGFCRKSRKSGKITSVVENPVHIELIFLLTKEYDITSDLQEPIFVRSKRQWAVRREARG